MSAQQAREIGYAALECGAPRVAFICFIAGGNFNTGYPGSAALQSGLKNMALVRVPPVRYRSVPKITAKHLRRRVNCSGEIAYQCTQGMAFPTRELPLP